jgi:hypothetical protein
VPDFPRPVCLGHDPDPALHPGERHQFEGHAEHGELARGLVVLAGGGKQPETTGGLGGGTDEHVWQLAESVMPCGNSGVGDQRGGVGGHGGAEYRGTDRGQGADPGEFAGDGRPGGDRGERAVDAQQPGPDVHRRTEFHDPQHVQKPFRAAKIAHQCHERQTDPARRGGLGDHSQSRTAGGVRSGGQ